MLDHRKGNLILRAAKVKIMFAGMIFGVIFVVFTGYLAKQHIGTPEEQRLSNLKQIVELGRNSIEPILVKYRSKQISKIQTLEQVRNLVRRMVYEDESGKNYVFMSSYDGIMLVQPFEPQREMTNMWNLKDAYGLYIIRELIKTAESRNGSGYVSYYYKRPNQSKPEEKISFVIGIPELNCYIGTGKYMTDIRKVERIHIIGIISATFLLIVLLAVLVLFSMREVQKQNLMLQQENEALKQAEEALRESEGKFRNISENSLVGIYIIQDGIFKYVNPKFAQIFGYSVEECFNSMSLHKLVHPEDLDTVQEHIRKRASGTAKSVHYTTRGVKKSGEIIHLEIFGSSIRLNGNIVATGTMLDISSRKQLEAQLKRSQKLESIGNLAGGIAHDFNNILAIILGFTELSLDEVQKGSVLEANLQEVYTASERGKGLVKQILIFARQTDEEIKPVKVDSIVKEVVKFIRSSIPTTIEIKQNIESKSLIMGNATKIHQVLMNLCTNAAYAMEDKGGILDLTLKDSAIDNSVDKIITNLKNGNYIEIKVSDTGTGIDPEIIESIFEPYFTTKRVGEGTGMGLAMVHGIVESYGGEITVDSALGKGTVFKVYLPITSKSESHRPYESETLPFGTERILYVDDEAAIAKIGSQILERLGYSVTIRTSSIEALELFRSKPNDFDLVISDMTMPNMTGDALAVELMKIRAGIPVIILTGYSKKINDQTASDLGIKAFAYKPIVKADLAKTVRKVLNVTQGEQSNGSILLIDDEPQFRKLFIQKMAGEGYEIIEACNGKDGLKLYREHTPDLIVTDLVMPEKEGIETIRELKEEFPDVKIIVVSGGGRNIPDAYLKIAKQMGAEHTFSKPVDWPEMRNALKELIS